MGAEFKALIDSHGLLKGRTTIRARRCCKNDCNIVRCYFDDNGNSINFFMSQLKPLNCEARRIARDIRKNP